MLGGVGWRATEDCDRRRHGCHSCSKVAGVGWCSAEGRLEYPWWKVIEGTWLFGELERGLEHPSPKTAGECWCFLMGQMCLGHSSWKTVKESMVFCEGIGIASYFFIIGVGNAARFLGEGERKWTLLIRVTR